MPKIQSTSYRSKSAKSTYSYAYIFSHSSATVPLNNLILIPNCRAENSLKDLLRNRFLYFRPNLGIFMKDLSERRKICYPYPSTQWIFKPNFSPKLKVLRKSFPKPNQWGFFFWGTISCTDSDKNKRNSPLLFSYKWSI